MGQRMIMSEYRKEKRDKLKIKVIQMYKKGYTFREVSKALNVSHEWARQAWLHRQSTEEA